MKISEQKLRRIIREEIAEAYEKDDKDWKNPSKRDRARLGADKGNKKRTDEDEY